LEILAIPVKDILSTLEKCGQKGVEGVSILCQDFESRVKDDQVFLSRIKELSLKRDFGVLGPDTLSFMRPGLSLNSRLFPKNAEEW